MFRKPAAAVLIGMCAIFVLAFSADAGSRDHPLFKSPSGYQIVKYSSGAGALTFPSGAGTRRVSMSGRLTEIFYCVWGCDPLSTAALGKRFFASLQRAGGEVVFWENPALGGRLGVGKFVRPGRDIWVMHEVISRREYRLYILETPSRRADVRRASVSEEFETEAQVLDLLHTLERTGRLDLPIRFSAGSSTLQKGYETDFKKFVMLMEKDPSLKFRISSYVDQNLRPADQRILLRGRTTALLNTLTLMGADEERLTTEAPLGELLESNVPLGFVRLTTVDSVEPTLQ